LAKAASSTEHPALLSLKVDFLGSRSTSDGDLALVRDLDEPFGLGELIAEHLETAHLVSHPFGVAFRSILMRLKSA
jgi:hypothetical protein